jgi:hypothetical protein
MVFIIIEEWINKNKIKLNVEKTKYIMLTSTKKKLRGNIALKCLDETKIECVKIIKYLCITDYDLRIMYIFKYIFKKIGKKTVS